MALGGLEVILVFNGRWKLERGAGGSPTSRPRMGRSVFLLLLLLLSLYFLSFFALLCNVCFACFPREIYREGEKIEKNPSSSLFLKALKEEVGTKIKKM